MKFTLSWLKDHLETTASLDEIVQAMTMAGLEVEEVTNPAAKLAAFSVAKIVEAKRHPNADKLQVCQVETKDGMKEIVCGAPNARAGLVTIYAPIGAYVPGLGVTLVEKPVRGVVSNGMLCSGAELELDDESDGILEIDPQWPVGTLAAEVLGLNEATIDFEVTPNRPDWLGVEGIARDLAAAGVGNFKKTEPPMIQGGFPCPVPISVAADSSCPVFAARLIKNVKNGPSPDWLQRRLRAIGIKPRNILVDVTNYISYDRARPLHVYDASKLTGAIVARTGRSGETFKALDGETYQVEGFCVIADDAGVLGLGGIMGGEESGSSEATTDVLLESAWFEPLAIFAAGRATGIASDARYRFERGVDPGAVLSGLDRAAQLILDLAGGEASDLALAGEIPEPPAAVPFHPADVRRLSGLDADRDEVLAVLEKLGFTGAMRGRKFYVQPPSWRRDVAMSADLVEEAARLIGFDRLPEKEPPRAPGLRPPELDEGESRSRLARRALAAAGYLECVTWSFCSRADAVAFGGGAEALTLANPIAAELDCMRPTALPNLMRIAQKNLNRGFADARLFEVGPAYRGDGETEQDRRVAAIWQARPQRHWKAAAAPDLFDAKRDCLLALEAMGAPVASLQQAPNPEPWAHPGRSGALKLGPKLIAAFGEVHPKILAALDAEGPILALEIYVDALPALKAKGSRARPPLVRSGLMPVKRDFAFLVDESKPAADLVRAAFGADKALIVDVALFDVYRGQGVPEGKKSLAIEVTLQPKEKTLTDSEIDDVGKRVIASVAKAVGGVLRA